MFIHLPPNATNDRHFIMCAVPLVDIWRLTFLIVQFFNN